MAKRTKVELEQINTRLAHENEQLRAKVSQLSAQLEAERTVRGSRTPVYMPARAGMQAALRRLAQEYPERKSFTQEEVLGMVARLRRAAQRNPQQRSLV